MTDKAFQFKGSLFTLTVLHLYHADIDSFSTQLFGAIQKTPNFFTHAPIVIDLQKLHEPETPVDFACISQQLRKHRMIPVGVRGGSQLQHEAAIAAGLAILPKLNPEPQTKRVERTPPGDKTNQTAPTTAAILPAKTPTKMPTKIIDQPIRSGQQVYAKDGDLCVLSSVSNGAELLAAGNIHIYGTLKGRALAGVNGDVNARIFCQTLDAELISIAGYYLVSDQLKDEIKDQVQVFLRDNRLQLNSFTIK